METNHQKLMRAHELLDRAMALLDELYEKHRQAAEHKEAA